MTVPNNNLVGFPPPIAPQAGTENDGDGPGGRQPAADGLSPTFGFAPQLAMRMRAWEDGTRFYPGAIAICALCLGLVSSHAPAAGVIGAAAAGALFVLHKTLKAALVTAALSAGFYVIPDAQYSPAYWTTLAMVAGAGFLPRSIVTVLLRAPRWTWVLALLLATSSFCCILLIANPSIPDPLATAAVFTGSLSAAFLGAGLARHLAMVDARLLAWGEDGLVPVTRDLLLGRVTAGMLHDLAQPLNVISMANGNMRYIVEQLDIGEDSRRQLLERVARISSHTEAAAFILSLFRWFGRDGDKERSALNVRSALERAVAATKSNVRHHGVSVELDGNALDHLLPEHHGALEMMAVAALLSAFGSFIGAGKDKRKGKVVLRAAMTRAHVVVTVRCIDETGAPAPARKLDHATLWLVEQVALDAGGDFRSMLRKSQPTRFVMRLGRDDI
ncbi:sensor histidine kinase [Novosphingobium lindaniclasticum]|uniref:Uncharacterized protein n=1 Tax=Novosphingobium lindaniclasticum LE124 TaxID=1096930 RepID=T0HCM1_9SPHN|nr:hypothetical protein [Novosphingobium lindaniclasticum]EQB09863.1 hypothetical protein L284_18430 [Novosphingobium lindaniclasticum LE124]